MSGMLAKNLYGVFNFALKYVMLGTIFIVVISVVLGEPRFSVTEFLLRRRLSSISNTT